MILEMGSSVDWLGDPKVTLISEDGHQYLCHQSVLGICNENLRIVFTHDKMKEYVFIFQDTNHSALKELIGTAYSSFDILVRNYKNIFIEDYW